MLIGAPPQPGLRLIERAGVMKNRRHSDFGSNY